MLIDLYELTMAQAYWRARHDGPATFSLFARGYPASRSYYVAGGIDASLSFIEHFGFSDSDISSIHGLDRFDEEFLHFLRGLKFTGTVRSVSEGTVVFADEPLLEIDAPIIEGQLLETALLNIVTTHTNLASKAARMVHAAGDKSIIDFSARRTHGADAAFAAARQSWLAGFAGTSHVGAAAALGIPAVGTMAHSFIQSYEDELEAFRAYATEFPNSTVLLVDTWDVESGVRNAITVARELSTQGHRLGGIRIDSGDLGELSKMARRMLDEAGLEHVTITVSGGLDEFRIRDLLANDAPIDSFGVGSAFGVADDAPHIDTAYKLVEYDGRPVRKESPGKQTLPGRKQVWRMSRQDGTFEADAITYADEAAVSDAAPLLRVSMARGIRVDGSDNSLRSARDRCRDQIARLPRALLQLEPVERYDVRILGALATDSSR